MKYLFFSSVIALLFIMPGLAPKTSLPLNMTVHAVQPQVRQCLANGWQQANVQVVGSSRELLWKGPQGLWNKGAMLVLHGGGGQHYQWCVANDPSVEPQVTFSNMAIVEGFVVFLLNSSDKITDNDGRLCGKVWDDEVRDRANLDLLLIGEVIRVLIPQVRPRESRAEIFMTGLSSGGYMTARASTHFDNLITAFAPVASGDPYGWHRICDPALSPRRDNVNGIGIDNETGKNISEINACRAESYPHEKTWDTANPAFKPTFKLFQHENDGINDLSCNDKIERQLEAHGYRNTGRFLLRGGQRNLANHLWQPAYNRPILDFFASRLEQQAQQPMSSLFATVSHGQTAMIFSSPKVSQ